MASKVNYNLESLGKLKSKVVELQKDLSDVNTELKKKMEELEKDWQTPAGKDFFEKQKTSWDPEVKNYIQILGTLERMLGEAIQIYEDVEREANRLSI